MRTLYCALALCVLTGTALAQPTTYHGTWTLRAEDLQAGPISRDISALGADQATDVTGASENCGGFIDAGRPTLAVTFSGPSLRLSAAATSDSEADLVLAVQRADGSWLCADDTQEAGSLNPAITLEGIDGEGVSVHVGRRIEQPADEEPVDALIMAGLPGQDDLTNFVPSSVRVSVGGGGISFSSAEINAAALEFDPDARAESSVTIAGEGDSTETTITVLPEITNPVVGGECRGEISLAPNLEVHVAGAVSVLSILASADSDGVMVVRAPDGEWYCADDVEGTDPGVQISQAASGDYSVWVGTYSDSQAETIFDVAVATESLSDEPAMIPNPAIPGSPAVFGAIDPAADVANRVHISGEGDSEAVINVVARSDNANPLSGTECVGYLPTTPSFEVSLESEVDYLTILASADADAVMVLRAPDDEWFCSDDAEGLNPGIQVNAAAAGDYLVWVGLLQRSSEGLPSSVSVTTEPFSVDQMVRNPALPGSSATYEGGLSLDVEALETAALSGGGDSVGLNVVSSGESQNPLVGDECRGHLSVEPSLQVHLLGATEFVTFRAFGESDGVMAVHTPDGNWFCSDDAEGVNPGVQVHQAAAGDYSVWVGPFNADGDGYEAEVSVVTEAVWDEPALVENPNVPGSPATYGAIEPEGEATHSVHISGEVDSAAVVNVVAGDGSGNPLSGSECVGNLSPQPTLEIDLKSGVEVLAILANVDVDAVMVVRTPEDTWYCSDDAVGTNPGVQLGGAITGDYRVWLGQFGESSDEITGSVSVTTEALSDAPLMIPNPARAGSPATYEGVFDPDKPAEKQVTISGDGDSSELEVVAGASVANPLVGEACLGHIPLAPSVQVQLQSAVETLTISASMESDGVMVVRTPEGGWFCSDDAAGLDPGVQVADASPGNYEVWVGLFNPGAEEASTLSVETESPRGVIGANGRGIEGSLDDATLDAPERTEDVELIQDIPSSPVE